MSVPFMPHRFDDGGNLHLEKINDSLKKLQRDIKKNQDARYTHSRHVFDLAGLTNASAAVLRQYGIRRPAAAAGVEIVGIELYITATDTVTWTLTSTVSSWPGITLVDLNSATVAAFASSGVPVTVPSNVSDVLFTLAASAASTIIAGQLVVHVRCDRGNQGDTFNPYVPALLNSASSDAGSVLDTELNNAEAAVNCDANADKDVRIDCFVVRGLAIGASRVWRIPATQRRRMAFVACNVQAATGSVDFTVDGVTLNIVGTGVGARAVGTQALSGSQVNTPTNSANDTLVTIKANTAIPGLAYMLVFWS